MATIRFVPFETFSDDLELEDMIHVPRGTALKLVGIIRRRNWIDLRISGNERSKGCRTIRA